LLGASNWDARERVGFEDDYEWECQGVGVVKRGDVLAFGGARMWRMKKASLLLVGASVLGSMGCAEVYVPRPSGSVVVTSNGGNGYRVFKNGEDMGSEWAVADAVAGNPRAEAQADKATSERIGSIVSSIGGSVALGVGAALFADDASDNANNFPTPKGEAAIGLLVGGLVLYIVGGALQGSAHTHMFNAVNIYNDDLATRPVLIRPLPESTLVPRPGQGVYVTPGPGYAPQPVAPPPLVPRVEVQQAPPVMAPLPPPPVQPAPTMQ
jgi:hypothetical protein